MRRRAQYAGSWYPGGPEALRQAVCEYVSGGGPAAPAVGVISPHAGYAYSGPVAGKAYAAVEVPASVFVLAPSHRWGAAQIAVWDGEEWETPLGGVSIDTGLRAAILDSCAHAERDTASHGSEHSLELQLPFLQVCRPDAKIVPILISTHDPDTLESLGGACAEAIRSAQGVGPLIVASSDMTHYESVESARRKDEMALEQVRRCNPAGLLEVVSRNRISMCGVAPAAAMLFAARSLGPCRGEVVGYGTSGDVTGDTNEVVGYAAAVVRPA